MCRFAPRSRVEFCSVSESFAPSLLPFPLSLLLLRPLSLLPRPSSAGVSPLLPLTYTQQIQSQHFLCVGHSAKSGKNRRMKTNKSLSVSQLSELRELTNNSNHSLPCVWNWLGQESGKRTSKYQFPYCQSFMGKPSLTAKWATSSFSPSLDLGTSPRGRVWCIDRRTHVCTVAKGTAAS